MRIAIVGYGTAGQAAALFLERAGYDPEVFEQSPELKPVGAGFLLQPTGLEVLRALQVHTDALAVGARIERLIGASHRGRTVMDMRYADFEHECHGLGMTRGALFTLLHRAYGGAARIITGTRIVGVSEGGRYLCDDGERRHGPYDLVVAADGANSPLRAACSGVHRDPQYPWGAVWCLLPATQWPHPDSLQQRYCGTREMIGMLPVGLRPDLHDGTRWATFFFSVNSAALDGFDAAALAQMQDRVATLWPELAPLAQSISTPAQLNRARYRDVRMPCFRYGSIVFIGDAAHGMSPQLGQGVNMALLDAQALVQALADGTDLNTALVGYERSRRAHVAFYQWMSRWLTPLFQSDYSWLAWARDLAFGPIGHVPGLRREMLKVLTGTKRGWFG